MKKLLLGALLLIGPIAGCQNTAPATQATVASLPAIDTVRTVVATQARPPLPVLFAATDTLTRPMRELLQAQDLSALWQSVDNYQDGINCFDGFFGADHYHFAMVFTQATRDATNPALYHVAGKSRYFQSRNTRSFTGTLTIRQVADLSYPGFFEAMVQREEKEVNSLVGRTYTARAQLQLQEEVKENSGVFEGEVLLDFYVVPDQKPGFVHVFAFEGNDDQLPARGDGLLLRGNRRNSSTGQIKSFIVSPDVSAIAPFVFKDFMLNERMGQINPKYAKLGWNDYWANDEWWAASPTPSL